MEFQREREDMLDSIRGRDLPHVSCHIMQFLFSMKAKEVCGIPA
jgi:hypothetical protein